MNNFMLKRFPFGVFFILIMGNLHAQTTINSPYSRYGLGELNFDYNAYFTSMAGTSVAFRNPNVINYSNPASYSAFSQQTFLFDGGALFYPRILKNDFTTEQSLFAGLNNLQFAFPVMKNWGVSFGLFPYSNIGYKLKDEHELDSIGKVNYIYEGWGGLNTFYFGTGTVIFKGLSAGINADYNFGNITKRRVAVFDTTGFTNTRIRNKVNVSDIHFNVGLQYKIKFQKKECIDDIVIKQYSGYNMTLGLNVANSTKLNVKESILAEHFAGQNPDAISRDTVKFVENIQNSITLPLHISGGVFFEKDNRWLTGAEVQWQKWGDYTFLGITDSLKNSLRFSLGGALFAKEKPTSNMLKRATVLFGVHYYRNHLELKQTQLNHYGISFGLSMPVRRTGTALNISIEAGRSGTTKNNLIEETYGKIKIGIIINEKWFYRSKYE
jgi:hypothetical protein